MSILGKVKFIYQNKNPNKWGFINTKGEVATDFKCDNMHDFV